MSVFKSFSVASKTVKFNIKRYLCFFVMLFLIQTLFSSVLVLYTNNNSNQVEYLENTYDYHLQLQNLNDVQYSYIVDRYNNQPEGEEFFEVVSGTRSEIAGISRYRYDLNIKFYGNVSSCYKVFGAKYYKSLESEGKFKEFVTPLLRYELDYVKNTVVCALTCVLIFISGCVIIYLLDSIMVNHYKFVYGVYMTFGANFKKLFVNSFCEMVLISVLVFVPSQILTNLVCFAILRSNMLTFRFDILSTLLSFLMCIAVAGVPVFLNIKAVSRKTPLSLISALDNSNHISSPGSSSDFIGYKFPDSTEILSVKRFRKYVIKIMLSTVTFAVAFVCCAYLGTSYSKTLNIIRPQYNIVFNGYYPSAPEEDDKEESAEQDKNNVTNNDISIEDQLKGDEEDGKDEPVKVYQYTYTDEVRDYLYSFNGIEMILKSCSTPAFDINSHVKILKKNAGSSGGADTDSGDRCYLNADFTVLDGEVAKSIEYFGYDIEGDLSKVVNNGKYIAITDGYNNSRKFKLSVGDKIFIATDFEYFKQTPVYQSSDLDYIMALKLNSCSYKYTEYTVGAIINNAPVGSSFPVYMNSEQYMKLTGNPVIFDDIDIIIKDGMTEAEYRELGFNLRHAADYYSNMNLTNTDAQVLSQIEKNKKYESVYMFVAVMLLAVTPVIWMFSQILFYLKRRPEFDLYFSLGAPRDKIKRLFIIDGIVMSAISSLIYIILCLIAAYGVTACLNMPFSGVSEYMRFSYTLPVIPFVIGLAVCALSAFASCIVPYMTYIRSCHPIFVGGDLEDKKDIISEGETGV